jgi:hypothetical protein
MSFMTQFGLFCFQIFHDIEFNWSTKRTMKFFEQWNTKLVWETRPGTNRHKFGNIANSNKQKAPIIREETQSSNMIKCKQLKHCF